MKVKTVVAQVAHQRMVKIQAALDKAIKEKINTEKKMKEASH
jgi:hypothetical protein